MDDTKDIQFELESAFAEVFLSTRVTQVENKMLDEIRGWLQTENQTATIRKQEAVRRTIRMGYEYMQILLAQKDNKIVTFPSQSKPQQEMTSQIEHKEKKAHGGFIVDQVRAGIKVGNEYPTNQSIMPLYKATQNVDNTDTIEKHPILKESILK